MFKTSLNRERTSSSSLPTQEGFREVFAHVLKKVQKPRAFSQFLDAAFGVDSLTSDGFVTNKIRTAHYTLLTFVPVNLFQQFLRVANLYFLFIAILQLIPGLSPTSWFTTVFPLVIVLAVNMLKEGIDDRSRQQSDRKINARKVTLLEENGRERSITWEDISVGDILRVDQDNEIPADLIFLSSSDLDEGLCYVETANLDGETNLKHKQSLATTCGAQSADNIAHWAATRCVRCEMPNPQLYVFEGAVVSRKNPDDLTAQDPLSVDQLLLRGTTLRKVKWVIGLVVYTGPDSRIMMNRTPAPRKVTQLERHMNVLVSLMFCVLLCIASLMSMAQQVWLFHFRGGTAMWFLKYENKYPDFGPGFSGWLIGALRWTILLNGVIPISLYITLEVVKVFQCKMILDQDRRMYHRSSDTPFCCRTTNLNEDLGQVQYVMSDKTGTLTQNVMGFVWISVAGRMYGKTTFEDMGLPLPYVLDKDTPHALTLDPKLYQDLGYDPKIMASMPPPKYVDPGEIQSGRALRNLLLAASKRGASSASSPPPSLETLEAFGLNLALCNTVVPALKEDGRYEYQAASPDEEALVIGAAALGFKLCSRASGVVTMERMHATAQGSGESRYLSEYKVLAVLEFNSDRKRMSMLCRCPDGGVLLLTKGADATILPRLREAQPGLDALLQHLEEMSSVGYRTLVLGQRRIPEEEYQEWISGWNDACVALQGREEKVAEAAEKIEVELELVGATAVEDKLQDGVPQAIHDMLTASIKVWVLTGDKIETAISIAHSCRLFTEQMAIVQLREADLEGMEEEAAHAEVMREKQYEVVQLQRKIEDSLGAGCGAQVGFVVEGGALRKLLVPNLAGQLADLCCACKCVVACRVTPMQKALVVKLVQAKRHAIVLGIGDGANDVGMIQAAHIGCGISGREGRAAVLASDFSFAQFRFITRLLLFHGRGTCLKNMEVVWYAFYKNWVYNIPLFYFGFFSGFSTQPLFTTGLIASFNLIWTSGPTVAFAVLEQDLRQQTVLAHPELYRESLDMTRRAFMKQMVLWMTLGTWHSLAIFFVPVYVQITANVPGNPDDLISIGSSIFSALVIVSNMRVAIRTQHFTLFNIVVLLVSTLFFFPFLYGYSEVWTFFRYSMVANMAGVGREMMGYARYWLTVVVLTPSMALLPDLALDSFSRRFWPKMSHIYQEWEKVWMEQDDPNMAPDDGEGGPHARPPVSVSGAVALSLPAAAVARYNNPLSAPGYDDPKEKGGVGKHRSQLSHRPPVAVLDTDEESRTVEGEEGGLGGRSHGRVDSRTKPGRSSIKRERGKGSRKESRPCRRYGDIEEDAYSDSDANQRDNDEWIEASDDRSYAGTEKSSFVAALSGSELACYDNAGNGQRIRYENPPGLASVPEEHDPNTSQRGRRGRAPVSPVNGDRHDGSKSTPRSSSASKRADLTDNDSSKAQWREILSESGVLSRHRDEDDGEGGDSFGGRGSSQKLPGSLDSTDFLAQLSISRRPGQLSVSSSVESMELASVAIGESKRKRGGYSIRKNQVSPRRDPPPVSYTNSSGLDATSPSGLGEDTDFSEIVPSPAALGSREKEDSSSPAAAGGMSHSLIPPSAASLPPRAGPSILSASSRRKEDRPTRYSRRKAAAEDEGPVPLLDASIAAQRLTAGQHSGDLEEDNPFDKVNTGLRRPHPLEVPEEGPALQEVNSTKLRAASTVELVRLSSTQQGGHREHQSRSGTGDVSERRPQSSERSDRSSRTSEADAGAGFGEGFENRFQAHAKDALRRSSPQGQEGVANAEGKVDGAVAAPSATGNPAESSAVTTTPADVAEGKSPSRRTTRSARDRAERERALSTRREQRLLQKQQEQQQPQQVEDGHVEISAFISLSDRVTDPLAKTNAITVGSSTSAGSKLLPGAATPSGARADIAPQADLPSPPVPPLAENILKLSESLKAGSEPHSAMLMETEPAERPASRPPSRPTSGSTARPRGVFRGHLDIATMPATGAMATPVNEPLSPSSPARGSHVDREEDMVPSLPRRSSEKISETHLPPILSSSPSLGRNAPALTAPWLGSPLSSPWVLGKNKLLSVGPTPPVKTATAAGFARPVRGTGEDYTGLPTSTVSQQSPQQNDSMVAPGQQDSAVDEKESRVTRSRADLGAVSTGPSAGSLNNEAPHSGPRLQDSLPDAAVLDTPPPPAHRGSTDAPERSGRQRSRSPSGVNKYVNNRASELTSSRRAEIAMRRAAVGTAVKKAKVDDEALHPIPLLDSAVKNSQRIVKGRVSDEGLL